MFLGVKSFPLWYKACFVHVHRIMQVVSVPIAPAVSKGLPQFLCFPRGRGVIKSLGTSTGPHWEQHWQSELKEKKYVQT